MAKGLVNSFATPEFFEEQKQFLANLREGAKAVADLSNQLRGLEGFAAASKNLADLTKNSNSLVTAQGQLIEKGAILNGEYKEAITLIASENGHSFETVKVQREIVKLKQDQIRLSNLTTKAKKGELDAYGKLNDEYNKAARNAQNLAAQHGIESKAAIAAADTAKKLDTQLKAIDATIGKNQRNVGNYASGFSGLNAAINQLTREAPAFANSLQTGFLAISNNLPILSDAIQQIKAQNAALRAEGKPTVSVFKQLGSALFSYGTFLSVGITLLTLYGEEMVDFTKSLFAGKHAIDEVKEAQNALNEAFTSDEVKTAVKNVEDLRQNIQLAKDGIIDKEKVVKLYNETIGKTTGEVKNLEQAEKALAKNADAYVQMSLYKAAAAAAQDEAVKALLDSEKERLENEQKLINAQKSRAADSAKGINDGLGEFVERGIAGANYKDEQAAKKRIDAMQKISENFRKKAADIAAKNNFDIFGGSLDPDKPKKVKDLSNAFRELAASIGEFFLKLRSPKKDELDEWIKEIQTVADAGGLKVEIAATVKSKNDQLARDVQEVQEEANRALLGVENAYQAGLFKSTEAYENAKLQAVQNSADKQTQLRIDALKNIQQYLPQFGKEYADIQAQIDAEDLKRQQRHNEKKLAEDRSYNEKRKELIAQLKGAQDDLKDSAINAVNTAIQSNLRAHADEYEARIRQIDAQKQREIDAVNALPIAQEEKRKRIAAIEEKATKDQEHQEAERRKVVRQSAIVERTAALLKLGIDTYQKVAAIQAQAAVLLSNPVTAGLAPLALSQIPYVVGASAIAAGGILAQKLPELAEGTDGEYVTGAAITDEEGAEGYLTKSGKFYMGSDRGANIKNFSEPTMVIPNDEIMELSRYYMGATIPRAMMQAQEVKIDVEGLKSELKGVKRAIESKPVAQLNVTGLGMQRLASSANQITEYIKSFSA